MQIAAAGGDVEALLAGVRELPLARLMLVYSQATAASAQETRELLANLRLDIEPVEVRDATMLSVLRLVTKTLLRPDASFDEVHVNVSSGPRSFACAGTAAAFVHGLKAFEVLDGKPQFFPVLHFGYHEVVSAPKMAILRAIHGHEGGVGSLTELSATTSIEKPLLSYHLRGSKESKGLEQLGLVSIERANRGRLNIQLTPMGAMIVAAYDVDARTHEARPEGARAAVG